MRRVEHVLVSPEIMQEHFTCDLGKCQGGCCTHLGYGAPLEADELPQLSAYYPKIAALLPPSHRETLEVEFFFREEDGHVSTPLSPEGHCAYVFFEENGVAKCAFEKAWEAGEIPFRKPVSCHLYPIRVATHGPVFSLHYHRRDTCAPACTLGAQLKMPLYRFVREGLIRKFGADWYERLDATEAS
jgi:hypothetical protein